MVSGGRVGGSVSVRASWHSQNWERGGQASRTDIKVDFKEEAFKVLGGERKEGVWCKSRYS